MGALLEIKGLKKSFINADKSRAVIIDINRFVVRPAMQIGLEGSSGSGKTTFLNLIAGILNPDSGQIFFQGEDVVLLPESRRDAWRANHIGYVFQSFNLLQGCTALENVALGMAFSARGTDLNFAKVLLSRVGLSRYFHHRPEQMSVGQQQRVAVARALANKPRLVLADEPTGNLDSVRAQETISLIQDICTENNAALLLVSHDQAVLSRFNQRIIMSSVNQVS